MALHRVILSPIDQLMPTSYIRVFLVIRVASTDSKGVVDSLQQGLIWTQQQLPYIGGSIVETPSQSVGIEWKDDESPQIRVVSIPPGFPSLAQLEGAEQPFSEVWRLGCRSDRFGAAKLTQGLPAVDITCSMIENYLVLGISCFHNLWDIAGLSFFFQLWSKNVRASEKSGDRKVVEDVALRDLRLRRSLKPTDLPGPTNFRRNLESFDGSCAAELDSFSLQLDVVKLKEFKHQLSLSSRVKLSTNDFAIAIIWTSICYNRYLRNRISPDAPRLRILIDGRKHVFGTELLRQPYLGNLACPLFADLCISKDDSSWKSFNKLLLAAIDAVVSSYGSASSASFIEAISRVDSTSNVSSIRETHKAYNTQQLTSTSWSQAPMHVDFGPRVGRVEYVRIAPEDYKLEGMMLTLPQKRDKSSSLSRIELFIALHKDEVQDLRESKLIESLKLQSADRSSRARI